MKLGRPLLIGSLLVAGLLLTAVAVAFSSGFQTWAARRMLTGQAGFDVSLGRVAAGLSQVRLENVRVAWSGAVLDLPAVEIELPLLSAGLRHQVLVRRLTARGWTLDLTQAHRPIATHTAASLPRPTPEFSLLTSAYADGAAAAPPAVFAGVFSQLKLPVDLALAGVDLAGEVLLPAPPGRPAVRARLTITGGSLAAGRPGKFDYTASFRFEGQGVAVRELMIRGTLGVVMDTPRSISRVVAATTAEASGPKLPGMVSLTVDVSAARSAKGENYGVAVRSGSKQLAAIETSYAAGESHLHGTWRVDMHDSDLAPFVLGRELPQFEADGEGRFDLDTTLAELNASGRLKTRAARLAAIQPALAVLGAVQFEADFDIAQHGDATRVDRLAVTITGDKPVVTVRALQAFEFNVKTGELKVADPAMDLLGIAVQGLPLAWVGPLLGRAGLVATGDELQGEIVASARRGGFALRPKTPLTIGNLSLRRADGRPLLRAVDVALTASADYAPQGWQVEVAPFSARSGGAMVFLLEARAGQLAGKDQPIKATGKWSVQLPALLAQPGAGGAGFLTGGEAAGDFAASLGAKAELQVRLALTNLAVAGAGPLPAVSASLRVDVGADGKMAFNAPWVVEREGRKSDLTLAGTLVPGAGGRVVAARLASEQLVIDDLKVLAALYAASPGTSPADAPVAASAATSATAGQPVVPFWAGVVGQCALALKKVTYNDQFQATDVSGVIRLETDSLKLVDVRAGFGPDSTVRLNDGITFLPTGAQPYQLALDFGLDNFDLAPVFRSGNSARSATIEGRANLQSHVTATGATVGELVERARGELQLSSKGGIFRALSADLSDRIQKTQSRAAAIGSFLGIVPDDYANKTKIISDIAQALGEIRYDQLNLAVTRDASLDILIKDFTLISPEVRLGGSGLIRFAAGVPVADQALELQLSLGARGRLGELMKRAGLLEASEDNLGYAAFAVPLKLGGTLAKPDASGIRAALLNSALERSGLLDSLFGRGK
jgi:hypothetical protein